MRGIYHSSLAIEAFLERYPVKMAATGDNVYFQGKATGTFSELLQEGHGRLPTVHEFQAAYMQLQPKHVQQQLGCYNRMSWMYVGLVRDYHAGALLVEHPDVVHVFWSPLLDADGGVDYIICVNKRYAAVHVQTSDPHQWRQLKERRKSHVSKGFPFHLDLIVPQQMHVKGNVWLCRPEDIQQLASYVAAEGSRRPADARIWGILGLRPLELSEDLGDLMHAKQQDLDL